MTTTDRPTKNRTGSIFLALLLLAATGSTTGCATMTGPKVSRAERKAAQQLLENRALKAKHVELARLNMMTHQLTAVLPAWQDTHTGEVKDAADAYPYAGWLVENIDNKLAKAYALSISKGVLVVGVMPGSPAADAGLEAGDLLTRINAEPVKSVRSLTKQLTRAGPNGTIVLEFSRALATQQTQLDLTQAPKRIMVKLSDSDAVNATADHGGVIELTRGIVRFTRNDDELAIVLAHELAHITRGHLGKSFGQHMVASILGGVVGGVIEAALGGGGHATAAVTSAALRAPMAKNLEREADYVGLQYAHLAGYDVMRGAQVWERFAMEKPKSRDGHILHTHPTSPERLIALHKAADELTGTPRTLNAMLEYVEAAPSTTPLPPTGNPVAAPYVTSPIPEAAAVHDISLTSAQLDALVEQRVQERLAQQAAAEPVVQSLEDWLQPPAGGFYSSTPIKEMGLARDVTAYNAVLVMSARIKGKGERFALADGSVTWYAKFPGKDGDFGHRRTFRSIWYTPDHAVHHTETFNVTKWASTVCRSTLTWSPIREDLKGTWRVEVFEAEQLMDRRSFVLE